jgi:sec-independent protein translocase protein TatB
MGGLDPAKLLVILVLAMVLLGPERLPKAARQIGAFWHDLQAFRTRVEEEVRGALPDLDLPRIPPVARGGVAGYLTGMMADADRNRARPRAPGTPDPDGEYGFDGDDGFDSEEDDFAGPGIARPSRRGDRARPVAWQSSRFTDDAANPSPVVAPAGMPAGWHSRGADAPGWASGSLFSAVPGGGPEGLLSAEARLDLSDPSWN